MLGYHRAYHPRNLPLHLALQVRECARNVTASNVEFYGYLLRSVQSTEYGLLDFPITLSRSFHSGALAVLTIQGTARPSCRNREQGLVHSQTGTRLKRQGVGRAVFWCCAGRENVTPRPCSPEPNRRLVTDP